MKREKDKKMNKEQEAQDQLLSGKIETNNKQMNLDELAELCKKKIRYERMIEVYEELEHLENTIKFYSYELGRQEENKCMKE